MFTNMRTLCNGWLIEEYQKKFYAYRHGIRLSGFDSLDDIIYAIRNRGSIKETLEGINDAMARYKARN